MRNLFIFLLLCSNLAWANEAFRLSKDDAAAAVQRQLRGRVLSVDRVIDGRPAYRVKVVLPNGEVRVVMVDGQTGAIGH